MHRSGPYAAVLLGLTSWLAASGARAEGSEDQTEGPKEAVGSGKGEEKARVAPRVERARKRRGPADELVVEAGAGYNGGVFTAIQGHGPKVAHGAAFHLGLGWAWSVKRTQSVGAELYFDGAFDGAATVGPNSTGKLAPRLGVAFVLWGDLAHLRVGGGWSSSRYDAGKYSGPSVVFAAGFHVPLLPGVPTWKKPVFTAEFVPSFDLLKAGDETLNRGSLAVLLGFSGY